MEHSKLISLVVAKLKLAYPYYFKELDDDEFLGLVSMYQEELLDYNEATITNAIKYIIRNNKYMPTIKELIDACELVKVNNKDRVIELMINDGYFKEPREIEKTYHFLEIGVIPSWLLEDMKKYGYDDGKALLSNNQNKYRQIGMRRG